MYHYPISIKAFFIATKHNYFGKKNGVYSREPIQSPTILQIVAHKGIVGDRFYNIKPDFDGQVTFINAEVIEEIKEQKKHLFLEPAVNAERFRRNIVIEGVNVIELIGKEFQIGGVIFLGIKHCAPCKWMDSVMGKGTMRLMRGRGGLRAQVIKGGSLNMQETLLLCTHRLNFSPTQALHRPNIPK